MIYSGSENTIETKTDLPFTEISPVNPWFFINPKRLGVFVFTSLVLRLKKMGNLLPQT